MKQLIVNADDLGRAPGINQGIIHAHRKGIVTSTTVMINYPDAPAGLAAVKADAPHLGVGLHITLTSGRPVSPPEDVPTLVNADGFFYHISQWPTVARLFDADELRAEITAQFERFGNLTGRTPDHLDAHHHAAYLHPAALRALLDLAAAHTLPLRQSRLDASPDDALALLPEHAAEYAGGLLDALNTVLAEGPAPWWPARFESRFFGPHAILGDLLLILTSLPEDSVTELMCHPGYVDDALAGSSYTTQREDEIDHLTHAATRECVQAEGIELITFGNLTP